MTRYSQLWSILLLIACSSDDEGPALGLITDQTIDIGGVMREYLLYVPENQNNSPLVLLLHGGGDSAEGLLGLEDENRAAPYRRWLEIADDNNLVLAIPNGTPGTTDFRGWNDCRSDSPSLPELDDVGFLTSLMDAISEQFSIDEQRIYATGTSNGGHMALRLAYEVPDRLAAVGVILAAASASNKCQSEYVPLSMLFMNGTADPILPYEGGHMASNRGWVISAEESVQQWKDQNATPNSADTIFFDDINPNDGSTVRKWLWDEGREETEVVLYEIMGGGHTEPSLSERYSNIFKAIVGEQNGDIEMADEVWAFFGDKRRQP